MEIFLTCIKVRLTKGACITIQTVAKKNSEFFCIVIEIAVIARLLNAHSLVLTCTDINDWAVDCICSSIGRDKFNLDLKKKTKNYSLFYISNGLLSILTKRLRGKTANPCAPL